MRSLQYDAYGPVERLSLRDAPSPRPAAGPLVRVTVAALNPKDALFRKGKFKVLSGRRFPKHCGVDFAGVVEAPYGDLRAGDAVFGALSELRYGRGTLAELVAPRAAEVARIPRASPRLMRRPWRSSGSPRCRPCAMWRVPGRAPLCSSTAPRAASAPSRCRSRASWARASPPSRAPRRRRCAVRSVRTRLSTTHG